MTLKEQAQQLIASCEERDPGAWRLVLKHGPDLAQAYLDKCEEVARLRQALQNIQDITDYSEGRTTGYAVDACDDANDFARQALGENNDKTG